MTARRFSVILTFLAISGLSIAIAAQGVQAPDGAGPSAGFRTPWGEPDLQGIWSGRTLTPLERPARFADRPVLSPEEAAAVEEEVHSRPGRDDRSLRGTEQDVARAYNQHWLAPAERLVDGPDVPDRRSAGRPGAAADA